MKVFQMFVVVFIALCVPSKLALDSGFERKILKPFKYMVLLLHQISPQGNTRINQKPRVFYAWISKEIKDFTASQIILTMKDDDELDLKIMTNATTEIIMTARWENDMFKEELSETQTVKLTKKFYNFEIKPFIDRCLQRIFTHFHLNIHIGFEVVDKQTGSPSINFKDVFNTHDDTPFIIFYYHGFLPEEIKSSDSIVLSRQPRSVSNYVNNRLASQCQLHHFEIPPEKLGWFNVIWPETIPVNFCAGVCPTPLYNRYYNFTLYDFLLNFYRLNNGFDVPANFPYLACSPISKNLIWVIEQTGSNELVVGTHPVSVASCGCGY